MDDQLAVFQLCEVRIGDVLAFGQRVVDIHVTGPFSSPDSYYVLHLNDGETVEGRGATVITLQGGER